MKQPQEIKKITVELLFLLTALASLGALTTNIIIPAFPEMALEIKTTVKDLSATLAPFFITFAIGQLFIGPLSDRLGRKRLVIAGLVVFIIGCLICAVSTNLTHMIFGRIVQALGVCATSVLSRAIARDLFEGEALTRTLSLIMVAMAAAPGFSPLLGGGLNFIIGWRATFGMLAFFAAFLGIIYFLRLGETHLKDENAPFSFKSVLKSYWLLLNDRKFITPALPVSLVIGSLYLFFALAPALLIEGFGFSPFELSLYFAATVFFVFAGGLLAPKLSKKWGAEKATRFGLSVSLCSSLAIVLIHQNAILFCCVYTVFLFGMGIINPLGTAITLQPFGQKAGAASALLGFLQMSLAAIAIALCAYLPFSIMINFCIILVLNQMLAFFMFLRKI